MDTFKDKLTMVTVAGSGIGRELVCHLVAGGAQVAPRVMCLKRA